MRLNYVDAIRGIAILGVIITHTQYFGANEYPEFIKSAFNFGARGVQLFFLASAFTLLLSFERRKEKAATRNFFIRRFFRIAPMYYIGIAYYLYQDGFGDRLFLGDADSITWSNITANVLFVHGINPYWITSLVPGGWSITVEMSFYALVPLLVRFISSTRQAINFTLLSLLLAFVLDSLLRPHPLITDPWLWSNYLFLYFPNQLPVFGLGMVAYFIVFKNDLRIPEKSYLLFALLLLAQLIWGYMSAGFTAGLGFFLFLIGLSKYPNVVFVNRLTIFMGKISYSAYLSHFAVLHWLNHFELVDFVPVSRIRDSLLNFSLRLALVLLLTSLISWLLWTLIEKPFQALGKRLIAKLEA